jgi:hypothetical protein
MSCFFGHKYDKITEDGFQYCKNCGVAHKPNLCANGHIWENKGTVTYTGFRQYGHYLQSSSKWEDNKISQQCKVCGTMQSVWEFGHDTEEK